MLRAQKQAVAAAYRPQVGAFAELHTGRPGQNFFADRWTLYAAGGVSVAMPVFNWNRRGRDLELADIALRQLEDRRADFLRESESGLRQLFLQRDSLERKRSLLDRLEANAREDVGLKQNLYAESQIAHADLLAAMTDQERYRAESGGLEAQLGLLATRIDTLIGACQEEE
jgi:outer membrane protein TolC